MLGAVAGEARRRFGSHPAFVAVDGRPLSYADLDRRSDEVAVGLARAGVGEGDVVALVLPAAVEYPIAYLAAAKVGAVTAGVNTRLARPERTAVLEVADAKLVLDDLAAIAELAVPDAAPRPLVDDPARPVAIVFTSGTTGAPKGAVFANSQLAAICQADTGDAWGGGGRTIAATSFAHLGFMTKLAGNLHRGGTSYLTERWRAADALRMVEDNRITTIGGIPTQLALMLQEPSLTRTDTSSVASVVIGGGPATPALVRAARSVFGVPVIVRYSCTEAGIGTGTRPDDPDEDAEETVGRPQPGVELIIDGGEVCFRSAAVMSHYHGNAEATTAAFTEAGALRTGDLGSVDEHGRLRLAGRRTEMYVRGGYNVHPAEVEAVLAEHHEIVAVAVVSRPDDVMGEVGVAVVVVRAGSSAPSLDDLRAFAAARLARYKLPEAMVTVDALPLTAMEKVDRRALAALVAR